MENQICAAFTWKTVFCVPSGNDEFCQSHYPTSTGPWCSIKPCSTSPYATHHTHTHLIMLFGGPEINQGNMNLRNQDKTVGVPGCRSLRTLVKDAKRRHQATDATPGKQSPRNDTGCERDPRRQRLRARSIWQLQPEPQCRTDVGMRPKRHLRRHHSSWLKEQKKNWADDPSSFSSKKHHFKWHTLMVINLMRFW